MTTPKVNENVENTEILAIIEDYEGSVKSADELPAK